jgi:hypothetical protein
LELSGQNNTWRKFQDFIEDFNGKIKKVSVLGQLTAILEPEVT